MTRAMSAFFGDGDVWLMIAGLAVMVWSCWPQWRRSYRRHRRHQEWVRS